MKQYRRCSASSARCPARTRDWPASPSGLTNPARAATAARAARRTPPTENTIMTAASASVSSGRTSREACAPTSTSTATAATRPSHCSAIPNSTMASSRDADRPRRKSAAPRAPSSTNARSAMTAPSAGKQRADQCREHGGSHAVQVAEAILLRQQDKAAADRDEDQPRPEILRRADAHEGQRDSPGPSIRLHHGVGAQARRPTDGGGLMLRDASVRDAPRHEDDRLIDGAAANQSGRMFAFCTMTLEALEVLLHPRVQVGRRSTEWFRRRRRRSAP